eukprot:gnl/Ergobibamus_cyprinoides/1893.p1 GENE.gnl/Ergobibamus_cyprinoides/1893~~gnl/Ergobibamus_cyprinoides/1893.p1  ORF type:complete len:527 (+),score=79.06 gnl/Ergobibamus_cyprinoides/1893:141-1583(+)
MAYRPGSEILDEPRSVPNSAPGSDAGGLSLELDQTLTVALPLLPPEDCINPHSPVEHTPPPKPSVSVRPSLGPKGTNDATFMTVFVGDLAADVTEAALRNICAEFGTVTACRLVAHPKPKASYTPRDGTKFAPPTPFAFITYTSHAEAVHALDQLNSLGYRAGRALTAREDLHKDLEALADPSSRNVYIACIPAHWGEHDLRSRIAEVLGRPTTETVSSLSLLPDRFGRDKHRGVAFVDFTTRAYAELAIDALHGVVVGPSVPSLVARFADSARQKELRARMKTRKDERDAHERGVHPFRTPHGERAASTTPPATSRRLPPRRAPPPGNLPRPHPDSVVFNFTPTPPSAPFVFAPPPGMAPPALRPEPPASAPAPAPAPQPHTTTPFFPTAGLGAPAAHPLADPRPSQLMMPPMLHPSMPGVAFMPVRMPNGAFYMMPTPYMPQMMPVQMPAQPVGPSGTPPGLLGAPSVVNSGAPSPEE